MSAQSASGRGKTILVVDDEPQVCKLARDILTLRGYEVLTASGSAEAIRIFEQSQPNIDLLLTDVIMPEMNGVELAERFLKQRPQVPVLFISGMLEGKLLREERKKDIALLEKPFLPVELVAKVEQVLNSSIVGRAVQG